MKKKMKMIYSCEICRSTNNADDLNCWYCKEGYTKSEIKDIQFKEPNQQMLKEQSK